MLASSILEVIERITVAGTLGINYKLVLDDLNIKETIGLYIASKVLSPKKYFFTLENSAQQPFDLTKCDRIPLNLVVYGPEDKLRRCYGFTSYDEQINDQSMIHALQVLGIAGPKGCTNSEMLKMGVKNIIIIDKLVLLNVAIKRYIMPSTSNEKKRKLGNSASRISTCCTIVHLKKYANQYKPQDDGVVILPPDSVRDAIHTLILELLENSNVPYVPVSDLSNHLGLKKREMQYLREQVVKQNKQREGILKFTFRLCVPVTRAGNLGSVRHAWCAAKGDTYPSATLYRTRNMPYFDQIDFQLRKRGQLTSNEIRYLTGASRKKAGKTAQTLITQYGYPSYKAQEGKVIQINVLPRENSHRFINQVPDATRTEEVAADLNDKPRADEDVLEEPSFRDENEKGKKRKRESQTSINEGEALEHSQDRIEPSTKVMKSLEQQERLNMILEFLANVSLLIFQILLKPLIHYI
jgi:hypothetical protein